MVTLNRYIERSYKKDNLKRTALRAINKHFSVAFKVSNISGTWILYPFRRAFNNYTKKMNVICVKFTFCEIYFKIFR